LITASDLTPGPSTPPSTFKWVRNVNFDQSNVLPNLAGPGTIVPSTSITLNKSGIAYYNTPNGGVMNGSPYFTTPPILDGTKFFSQYFVWAIFDGTTNTPVVFPNGTSIDDLQNQLLVQISPSSLPFGIVNYPYPLPGVGTVQFHAGGGACTQPFTWSENAGVLDGIGLTLNPATGVLNGTPTQSGTFDFTLTMTDVNGRSVQFLYSITIQSP
jgi:hypothetical protein